MTHSADLPVILADIGGTNTRVALARAGSVCHETIRRFSNAESDGLPAILRGVAMVLASQTTVARIFASSIVPDVMSVDWAEAIYGALPNRPTPRKLQP